MVLIEIFSWKEEFMKVLFERLIKQSNIHDRVHKIYLQKKLPENMNCNRYPLVFEDRDELINNSHQSY